jgi:hypothetical protein
LPWLALCAVFRYDPSLSYFYQSIRRLFIMPATIAMNMTVVLLTASTHALVATRLL